MTCIQMPSLISRCAVWCKWCMIATRSVSKPLVQQSGTEHRRSSGPSVPPLTKLRRTLTRSMMTSAMSTGISHLKTTGAQMGQQARWSFDTLSSTISSAMSPQRGQS